MPTVSADVLVYPVDACGTQRECAGETGIRLLLQSATVLLSATRERAERKGIRKGAAEGNVYMLRVQYLDHVGRDHDQDED